MPSAHRAQPPRTILDAEAARVVAGDIKAAC